MDETNVPGRENRVRVAITIMDAESLAVNLATVAVAAAMPLLVWASAWFAR